MISVEKTRSIASEELSIIETWLHDSGMRWGLNAAHRRELDIPADERFTIADGLDRLFLGYALPEHMAAPCFDRIPAGNPEGSRAEVLGAFAQFLDRLTTLRSDLRQPRLPDEWLTALLAAVDTFLAPAADQLEELGEVRDTVRELHENLRRGGVTTPLPLAVVRAALESLFDDPARGGVPTGAITFSSMSSLRNLPFRFIGVIGLNDGLFPSAGRPREFDLMAAAPRPGDRQRRLDDRNLFLDLCLAARERFYVSYTGRSIRDNSVLPPSVVVAELIETLLPALARPPGDAKALGDARSRLIVEHPLQAFDDRYFDGKDPRRRSFNSELCEALRHARAPGDPDADDARRFFAVPLAPPGAEWRQVSLDQLQEFFRNPAHFLLRRRLGMSLFRDEGHVADEEPFLPDWTSRQALAERLLPQAMLGADAQTLNRLARAGIEYPPGVLGSAALDLEMSSLQRFAAEVRETTQGRLPPLAVELPFVLDGEPWQLAALLTDRYDAGLVRHRYDDKRASDYLSAWLTHLVAAAASPLPPDTRWISRNGSFRFTPCSDARVMLGRVLELYRRGLREPIHFFPKSAWEYVRTGRDLAAAKRIWHDSYEEAFGEDHHDAYRLALRGVSDPLDADFVACAEIVLGPSVSYLEETTR